MPELTEDDRKTARDLARIARINEVSAMARTSWIAMLGYFAFVFVTLLGVEDADFFVPSRQTDLPLVNVAIPTASFFWFAPALGAALYVYLQLILLKLWDAIADVEASHLDGHRVGDLVNPWLANDWALMLRGGAFAPDRPLRTLGFLATIGLVWLVGPVVLGFAWWRSMPAHDEWMTLWLGGWFALALLAGIESCRNAWERLGPGVKRNTELGLWRRPQALAGILLTLLAIGAVGWDRTESGVALPLAPADLANVEMVVPPDGWRDFEVARHAYRETWCKREGLEMLVCGQLPTSDAPMPTHVVKAREAWCGTRLGMDESCKDRFAAFDRSFGKEWRAERQAAIGDLLTLDLSRKDFRFAFASGVTLEGAILREAHLEHADLSVARLEGADLRWARLDGAYLMGSRLEGASLRKAWLEGADLSGARLKGADLSGARLKGTDLRLAWLEGADLSEARLEGADFSGARLEGANLIVADFHDANWAGASNRASPAQFADFRTSQDLTQSQLEHVIGNEHTLLPDRPNGSDRRPHDPTGDAFYVWSCWETPPDDLDAIVILASGADANEVDRENLRHELLCGLGNPRRRTGTPLALDAPYPDGHPFLWLRPNATPERPSR